jgi:hypothetical protein
LSTTSVEAITTTQTMTTTMPVTASDLQRDVFDSPLDASNTVGASTVPRKVGTMAESVVDGKMSPRRENGGGVEYGRELISAWRDSHKIDMDHVPDGRSKEAVGGTGRLSPVERAKAKLASWYE